MTAIAAPKEGNNARVIEDFPLSHQYVGAINSGRSEGLPQLFMVLVVGFPSFEGRFVAFVNGAWAKTDYRAKKEL